MTVAGAGAPGPRQRLGAHGVPHTRAGHISVMLGIAGIVFTGPVVFVAQNSGSSRVSFLVLHGRMPVTLALVAGAAIGWVPILVLGCARALRTPQGVSAPEARGVPIEPASGASEDP